MATQQSTGGGQPLPTALLAQAVPMLTRHELEALTERLIDALDSIDIPTEELEPESDYCLAGDDRGSGDKWGTSGISEDDEMSWQSPTLNAA